jgi:hypothetical protein
MLLNFFLIIFVFIFTSILSGCTSDSLTFQSSEKQGWGESVCEIRCRLFFSPYSAKGNMKYQLNIEIENLSSSPIEMRGFKNGGQPIAPYYSLHIVEEPDVLTPPKWGCRGLLT